MKKTPNQQAQSVFYNELVLMNHGFFGEYLRSENKDAFYYCLIVDLFYNLQAQRTLHEPLQLLEPRAFAR